MPEDGYPLGRGFLPAARYDADTNQRTVINLAGTFVPATEGGKFPGRARSHHALISGGAAGGHTVTNITVNDDLDEVLHFTAGALTADLTPWSAGSGPFADFQFAQLPLSRLGADESDTLEQGLSILAVSLTDGG